MVSKLAVFSVDRKVYESSTFLEWDISWNLCVFG